MPYIYIIYALLCFPAQGFNSISAVGQIAETLTGKTIATNSALYWISFAILMIIAIPSITQIIDKARKDTLFNTMDAYIEDMADDIKDYEKVYLTVQAVAEKEGWKMKY